MPSTFSQASALQLRSFRTPSLLRAKKNDATLTSNDTNSEIHPVVTAAPVAVFVLVSVAVLLVGRGGSGGLSMLIYFL